MGLSGTFVICFHWIQLKMQQNLTFGADYFGRRNCQTQLSEFNYLFWIYLMIAPFKNFTTSVTSKTGLIYFYSTDFDIIVYHSIKPLEGAKKAGLERGK